MVYFVQNVFATLLLVSAMTSAFLPAQLARPMSTRVGENSLYASSADTPAVLPDFASKEAYMEFLKGVSGLPKGFATGTASGKFIAKEAPAMGPLPIKGTVIHLTEGPTDNWAAVFTSNKFPGAPVIVGRKRLSSGGPLNALVINNKVSNVCSGGDGVGDSEMVCEAVASALKLEGGAATVLPSSTGVIGWRLPAKELASDVVPEAIKNLDATSGSDAATAIMTTDRWPKLRSKTLKSGARLVGIAKGAGMIEVSWNYCCGVYFSWIFLSNGMNGFCL